MAFDAGQLKATLTLDDKDFNKGIGSAKQKSSALGKTMGVLGKGALVAGAAVVGIGIAAGTFAAASVKAFGKSEQVWSQLGATIKSTGGAAGFSVEQFMEHATALQNLTGVSDEAVGASQAMLSTFTKIAGPQMKLATETVLDMATALNSGAIPSQEQMAQQSIQLGKALNDPIKGLTALTRVGVTFDEAQKKQIETMVAANDIVGAQNLILQELQKEFGGSAKAAGETFNGQMLKLKETWGDFMELVGLAIVKVIKPAIEKFTEWTASIGGAGGLWDMLVGLKDRLDNFLKSIYENNETFRVLINILVMVFEFIKGSFLQAWDQIKMAFNENKEEIIFLAKVLGGALYIALVAVGTALGIVVRIIGGLISLVLRLVGAVVDLVQWLGKITGASKSLSNIGSAIGKVFGARNQGEQMAAGGIVRTPTRALLGESGPEMVLPLSGSRSVTNNVTMNNTVRNDQDDNSIVEQVRRVIGRDSELQSRGVTT